MTKPKIKYHWRKRRAIADSLRGFTKAQLIELLISHIEFSNYDRRELLADLKSASDRADELKGNFSAGYGAGYSRAEEKYRLY